MHFHLRLPAPPIILVFNHEARNIIIYQTTKFQQNGIIRGCVVAIWVSTIGSFVPYSFTGTPSSHLAKDNRSPDPRFASQVTEFLKTPLVRVRDFPAEAPVRFWLCHATINRTAILRYYRITIGRFWLRASLDYPLPAGPRSSRLVER